MEFKETQPLANEMVYISGFVSRNGQ
jgi:hypothetical protein